MVRPLYCLVFVSAALCAFPPRNVTTSRSSLEGDFHLIFQDFIVRYWRKNTWHGASGWTSDLTDRILVRYLRHLSACKDLSNAAAAQFTDTALTNIVNRAFNRNVMFEYFTQANDDFGWLASKSLDVLEFTHEYEMSNPSSPMSPFLPHIRQRLAFRASFFHDIVQDSWSSEICGGGVEWLQRPVKNTVWPTHDSRGIFKNTITNHLYIGNSAQIYDAYPGIAKPVELTEVAISFIRFIWKKLRFVYGWEYGHQTFDFQNINLLKQAFEGILWMQNAGFLTRDLLYGDGVRLSAKQGSSRATRVQITCEIKDSTLYTYNQLAGLRARRRLFEISGNYTLLEEGHATILNLIRATKSGLFGSQGILEDTCDQTGYCDQDNQAFKGSTFVDLIDFCRQLQYRNATEEELSHHRNKCRSYRSFVDRNALAAYSSQDDKGNFGGAWLPLTENVNGKGRGRSIETQISALAVLTAKLVFDKL